MRTADSVENALQNPEFKPQFHQNKQTTTTKREMDRNRKPGGRVS
jgi:hypothetical protein